MNSETAAQAATAAQPQLENPTVDIKKLIDWVNKKKETNRKSSRNYYEKNYKIAETMTEEQKLAISEKIKKRQEYFKLKYNENKELYKARVKEARTKAKLQREEQEATQAVANN